MRVRVVLLMASTALLASTANASPIEQACRASGREAAAADLCACIGVAAALSLSEQDQRQAAEFFSDPQAAQDMRQSDRRRDERFWERYQSFIQTAEDMCG